MAAMSGVAVWTAVMWRRGRRAARRDAVWEDFERRFWAHVDESEHQRPGHPRD